MDACVFEEWKAIDKSDWRNTERDVDRLCEIAIKLFENRDGITREALLRRIDKDEFHNEVSRCMSLAPAKTRSIVLYTYFKLKYLIIPRK